MSENIIAIDPGYDRCGVAILSKNTGDILFSTCIETNKKDLHENRVFYIGEALEKIIQKWSPSLLAIETLFFSLNKKTALKVAEARGVIIYVTKKKRLSILEIAPQTIKTSLTGVGNASKEQVRRMVSLVTKKVFNEALDDEIDAIAIGLTAIQLLKLKKDF